MIILGLAGLGLVAGFLGGALGVGGGVFMVPILVLLFRFDIHLAIGTSLAAVVLNSLAATWRHGVYANVDWQAAAVLGALGIVGAILGAAAIQHVPDLWAKRAWRSCWWRRRFASGRRRLSFGAKKCRAGYPARLPRRCAGSTPANVHCPASGLGWVNASQGETA